MRSAAVSSFFGLRTQAFIVSTCLILLTGLLGLRAHRVARNHYEETRNVVSFDLNAQALLVKLRAVIQSKQQAERKFAITRDKAYSLLVEQYVRELESTSQELGQILIAAYPELFKLAPDLTRSADLDALKGGLETRYKERLEGAQEAAFGILRLILGAMVLSLAITGWLAYLFYRGLIDPLKSLRHATGRIRNGDLGARVSAPHGVTELLELSRSFNLMAERLQSLDQAKREFLATVSHEIKNPLAALKEGLALLSSPQAEALSPQSKARGFNACLIASKRVEAMINNLLKLSGDERGLFDFETSLRSLPEAIQTAVDEVRPLADKKGIAIRLGVAELQAFFNWDGMVQVFENLLLNAIKYGHENSTIEIRASRGEDNRVEVAVINSGAELAPGEQTRIFERFYRGANSDKQQGLGVGLHVVKKIIEAHRGEIGASSQAGQTRLQFWIPVGGAEWQNPALQSV